MPLLNRLNLSRTEREVARRFEADPQGRSFLPVADILRASRLIDESLELLTQGVALHPTFTVARVVLARELLNKGMVEASWRTLEESPVPLQANLLAQKLRFRLAVLLFDEANVRATYHHLKLHQMLDHESKRLGDLIDISGLEAAHVSLVKEMRAGGTEAVLPPARSLAASAAANDASLGSLAAAAGSTSGVALPPTVSAYFRDEELDGEPALGSFHVVPLDEIFRPSDTAGGGQRRGAGGSGGIELDSTTLADIYARQGHYGKALEVYRRLLRMTPNSDLLRRQVAELAKLDREQKVSDLTVDPGLVDRMETVEIIDRQIRFFNDLLTKLT